MAGLADLFKIRSLEDVWNDAHAEQIARNQGARAYPDLHENLTRGLTTLAEKTGTPPQFARGTGEALTDVAAQLPGTGQILAAEDVSKNFQGGNYLGAMAAALGAVPGGGPEAKAAAEVEDLAGTLSKAVTPIKVYHGSPHSFDKFDISKIGTGEGAQAYGHGLYFAENEGVARQYRDNLARPDFNVTQSGTRISSDLSRMLEDSYDDAMRQGVSAPSHRDAIHLTQQNLDRQRQNALKAQDFDWFNKVSDQITELQRIGKDAPATKGSLYEVDINADPEHFLDWDKPLSEHPEHIRNAIVSAAQGVDPMGQLAKSINQNLRSGNMALGIDQAYTGLGGFGKEGQAAATEALSKAGIPGIKYLDQGSRATGEGSRNYVVFDDKLISIVKKNGIAVALAAGLITESQAAQLREQGYE